MSYLHDQGWTTITTDQLADLMANRECPPAKEFVASFDDGPEDGYTHAAPILEHYGMHGTFFVTTGLPDAERPGRMTWDQLRVLISHGHAIGNHTETHLSLNKQPADVIAQQIEGAQEILQQQLGYRPRTFAYPYGRYNDLVLAQVAASGFDLAFTVHAGAKESSDDPFEAHRIEVASNASGADILSLLAPFSQGCRPPTPDLSVALSSSGPFKGNDVYAAAAQRSQSVTRVGVKVGQTYRYWLRIDNDAQQAGQFSIVPAITGTAVMDVRYKITGVDVTSALKSGTYVTPILEPWTSITIVVRVTPLNPRVVGQSMTDTLRAASTTDPARVDVARVVATY
jgi:peptidoglycan/xylan/chitin deacetylase (PgdA/CDA1 family)